ncbi:response regulator transcription factor [Deinococcus radiotolerans]|uniref:HTH luxR-type domain-containing protein n=1 Tax=Deinococcus radiotolerans TaxID=1309407 RepID=A0ABQ2FRE7_9DEIO|nr:LuxR C-terminal-related transcriptional regulator [Deinococcus radiotolerans]GGL19126.1 hypothetical protein GCM10010844_42610 [Deinococcus radiotolerans]
MTDQAIRFGPLGQPYQLICGVPAYASASDLTATLRRYGWVTTDNARIALIMDAPWGNALQQLRSNLSLTTVVVTNSPCPEYWEDLWGLQPAALLAGSCTVADVAGALKRAAAGESFRQTPRHDSLLTSSERKLLQLTAMGLENKRIARELHITEGTVKNGLGRIYIKLGLANRTQLALYYWGLWTVAECMP